MAYTQAEVQPTAAFRCAQVLCTSAAAVAMMVSLLWFMWLVWPALSRERPAQPAALRQVEAPVFAEPVPDLPPIPSHQLPNQQPVRVAKGRPR